MHNTNQVANKPNKPQAHRYGAEADRTEQAGIGTVFRRVWAMESDLVEWLHGGIWMDSTHPGSSDNRLGL